MKKIFALALAAVMTAGMTTVAFAADDVTLSIGDELYHVVDGVGEEVDTSKDYYLVPGDTYYISLDVAGGDMDDVTKSIANKYKVYDEWKVGEGLISDFDIEYKKLDSGDYEYVVTFTVPEQDAAKTYDVAGDIKVAKSKTEAKKETDPFKLDTEIDNVVEFTTDSIEIDKQTIVKFGKDLTDVEITWGDNEVAMFEVNVAGQGKLNLAYNTDFDEEFAAKYEYANIDFLTFEGEPSFNRTGKLYIYAEEGTYLYEVTADGAKAVKAEYDEDYEAWVLNTRTLKAYAISDVELDEQTVTEDKTDDESSKTDDGVKENPDTGR